MTWLGLREGWITLNEWVSTVLVADEDDDEEEEDDDDDDEAEEEAEERIGISLVTLFMLPINRPYPSSKQAT